MRPGALIPWLQVLSRPRDAAQPLPSTLGTRCSRGEVRAGMMSESWERKEVVCGPHRSVSALVFLSSEVQAGPFVSRISHYEGLGSPRMPPKLLRPVPPDPTPPRLGSQAGLSWAPRARGEGSRCRSEQGQAGHSAGGPAGPEFSFSTFVFL